MTTQTLSATIRATLFDLFAGANNVQIAGQPLRLIKSNPPTERRSVSGPTLYIGAGQERDAKNFTSHANQVTVVVPLTMELRTSGDPSTDDARREEMTNKTMGVIERQAGLSASMHALGCIGWRVSASDQDSLEFSAIGRLFEFTGEFVQLIDQRSIV